MPRKKTGFIQTIKTRCRNIRFAVRRMLHRGADVIHNIAEFLMVISGIAALACIVCLVIHVGYEHSPQGFETISRILRAMQWIFGANVIFGLTFNLGAALTFFRQRSERFLEIMFIRQASLLTHTDSDLTDRKSIV